MSGGHFQYDQDVVRGIADEIVDLIKNNEDASLDEYGDVKGTFYSPKTIEKFEQAVWHLRRAAAMAHRVDWLVSGDDGEATFHKRWEEDLTRVDGAYMGGKWRRVNSQKGGEK